MQSSCPVSFTIPFFLLVLFLASPGSDAGAQYASAADCARDTVKYVVIREVIVEGYRQTRLPVIWREMEVKAKDTVLLTDLPSLLKQSRENIFNTRLFNFVTVDTLGVRNGSCQIDVRIHVVERWYVWPWPYFEISDRNFNSWLETTDFSRLTYGIDLTVMNVRGRNETLVLPVHFGFNQKYGFRYTIPYLDKRQVTGLSFGADYERNHEVIYADSNNKPVYYKDPDEFPRRLFYGFAELQLRPGIFSRHYFRLMYNYYLFSDTLVELGYSIGDLNRVQYASAFYQYKNDHRDEHFYPLKGSYFDISMTYNGLFSDYLTVIYFETNLRKFWQIWNRWYVASGITAKYSFAMNQPYFIEQGLGYGRNYVRGYEYYVINGQHYVLWKNNLKFALVPKRVLKVGFLKSQKFNAIPYAFYLNVFTDLGFVYNNDGVSNSYNDLQNSLLVGYGAGIDFATYYDVVIRLEFSLNGMGEPGLYLHFTAPI